MLRPLRLFTYRYGTHPKHINDWLDRVTAAAVDDVDYGLAVAQCIEIVRGYGETYERGLARYRATVDPNKGGRSADAVRRLHRAALADEKGVVFEEALASTGVGS